MPKTLPLQAKKELRGERVESRFDFRLIAAHSIISANLSLSFPYTYPETIVDFHDAAVCPGVKWSAGFHDSGRHLKREGRPASILLMAVATSGSHQGSDCTSTTLVARAVRVAGGM